MQGRGHLDDRLAFPQPRLQLPGQFRDARECQVTGYPDEFVGQRCRRRTVAVPCGGGDVQSGVGVIGDKLGQVGPVGPHGLPLFESLCQVDARHRQGRRFIGLLRVGLVGWTTAVSRQRTAGG